ncbi:hypothetical protein RUM43_007162 [Polyplax serrata]|uniref:Uncharacterized protein n=1 Tax=Polyplax serrata TaxID=468196 RepID=A0AAN8PLS8_POLSC
MDRLNYRKGHETKRLQSSPLGFSPAEQDFVYNDKNKLKKHSHFHKKKYETNSYLSGWPAQARMYPVGQRSFSTPDSSICHYSVPLSFSFEPVSLPIYSALIQPQGNYGIPARTSSNSRKSNKLCSQNRKSKGKTNTNSMHEVPAMFNTCRISNGDQQDYTSLPPVNCDVFAPKSVDNNLIFRRRFSDPGIGQLSSDDCFSSKSDDSETSSTQEPEPHDFFILIEQMNDLKKSNSNLRKELQETKLELELLKVNAQSWRSDIDDFKPGALSDAISEIRCAVKLSEEALVSKVTQMVENISEECKEINELQKHVQKLIVP